MLALGEEVEVGANLKWGIVRFKLVPVSISARTVSKRYGRLNALIAFKYGEINISCNFDVLDINDIHQINNDELRDVDVVGWPGIIR